MPKLFLLFIGLSLFIASRSQDRSHVKFGKISPAELKTKFYSIDSNASSVIVADIGSSEIAGNMKGWFSIEFRHFRRIHILNQKAYDLANVEIFLYKDGNDEERLLNLKAHTYNLENGKVVETKVDVKSSVYKSMLDKNHIVQKFTFPAIKEGSIIEYEYTISSDFIFNLQPWKFQGDHPVLWSEYEVSIPEFFYYVFLQHGDFKKTQKTRQQSFRVTDTRNAVSSTSESFVAVINDYRMIMKNILPLNEESFTSTLANHTAKIEFQLAEYRSPLVPQNIMGDWEDVCETLLADENFGGQLNKDNNWMNDELKIALGNAANDEEKMKNIYKFLRDNFTCTNYNRLYADQPLKNVLKNRKGSEAEINLLLVAMLRKIDANADPVMLSTKSHGYAYSNYPIMERFNYVVCRLKINDKIIYLDASKSQLGFGRLHWECYNGHARVINEEATPVEFFSDSLTERKVTSLMLFSNEKGEIIGVLDQTPGYYESYDIRNGIKEKGLNEYIKEVEKDLPTDIEIKNYRIDLLEKLDEQIQINYNIKLDIEKKDVIYLDPMFGEGFSENPFASEQRTYPVEMPYAFDEIYVLRMDLPNGYEVDELPASTKVNFDEKGKSYFEYIVENAGTTIQLRSRIKMHRSYFLPDEYKILHDFFSLIVSKHNEKIVLKKIKKL